MQMPGVNTYTIHCSRYRTEMDPHKDQFVRYLGQVYRLNTDYKSTNFYGLLE